MRWMACPALPCRAGRSPPPPWPTTVFCGWRPTRAWPGWTLNVRTSTHWHPAFASATCCMAANSNHCGTACACRPAPASCRSTTWRFHWPARSATAIAIDSPASMTAGRTQAAAPAPITPTWRREAIASTWKPPMRTASGARSRPAAASASRPPSSRPCGSSCCAWPPCWRCSYWPCASEVASSPRCSARACRNATASASASRATCTTPCCRVARA